MTQKTTKSSTNANHKELVDQKRQSSEESGDAESFFYQLSRVVKEKELHLHILQHWMCRHCFKQMQLGKAKLEV